MAISIVDSRRVVPPRSMIGTANICQDCMALAAERRPSERISLKDLLDSPSASRHCYMVCAFARLLLTIFIPGNDSWYERPSIWQVHRFYDVISIDTVRQRMLSGGCLPSGSPGRRNPLDALFLEPFYLFCTLTAIWACWLGIFSYFAYSDDTLLPVMTSSS